MFFWFFFLRPCDGYLISFFASNAADISLPSWDRAFVYTLMSRGEGQHFSGAGRLNSCPLSASRGIAASLPGQGSNQDSKMCLKLAHGHILSPERDGAAAVAGWAKTWLGVTF